ncbi:MAG: hypothetical protein J5X22_18755 [Candidatus Accumulibacter sp.]|nr:hypothetical protein [Accumulibacter sp.]MBO3712455.1 hypothetical protein [Accumulibacter sp.]
MHDERRLHVQASKKSVQVSAMLAAVALAGCQTGGSDTSESKSAAPLLSGYTCCNLRHEAGSDWINELNYVGWPMIPLGTQASITSYGRQRAAVTIGGKPMRIGQDYTREQLSLEQYMARWIVPRDPKIKLATFPANIQASIKAGKVMKGMTREQVIMSVGYPLTQENPVLDAPMWRMWMSSFGEYQLMWGSDGKVKDIIGDPLTKNMIVQQ